MNLRYARFIGGEGPEGCAQHQEDKVREEGENLPLTREMNIFYLFYCFFTREFGGKLYKYWNQFFYKVVKQGCIGMSRDRLDSLERELDRSYSENLELNLDSKSPTFSEIMHMNKVASLNIKRMLRLN